MGAERITRSRPALDRLCAALTLGADEATALRHAGLSPDDLEDLRRRAGGENPSAAVLRCHRRILEAITAGEMRPLVVIDKAAQQGDARAAMWLLERRYPERWARRSVTATRAPNAPERSVPDVLDELAAARERRSNGG